MVFTQKMKNRAKDLCLKDLGYTAIARILESEFDISITSQTIRNWCKSVISEPKISHKKEIKEYCITLYKEGFGYQEIIDKILEEKEEIVSWSSIQRWTKPYRKLRQKKVKEIKPTTEDNRISTLLEYGYNYTEIGSELHLSQRQVKRRVDEGRKKFPNLFPKVRKVISFSDQDILDIAKRRSAGDLIGDIAFSYKIRDSSFRNYIAIWKEKYPDLFPEMDWRHKNPSDSAYEQTKQFLEMMHSSMQQGDKNQLTIPGVVLKYGIKFEPIVMPEKYQEHYGRMKECYGNSYNLAMEYPEDVIYCEGYAAKFFPVQHAWCMDRHTGELLEPTWREPGSVYWGIPFKYDYIIQRLTAGGYIDNDREGWPMLTGEHPVEDWLEKDFKKSVED